MPPNALLIGIGPCPGLVYRGGKRIHNASSWAVTQAITGQMFWLVYCLRAGLIGRKRIHNAPS